CVGAEVDVVSGLRGRWWPRMVRAQQRGMAGSPKGPACPPCPSLKRRVAGTGLSWQLGINLTGVGSCCVMYRATAALQTERRGHPMRVGLRALALALFAVQLAGYLGCAWTSGGTDAREEAEVSKAIEGSYDQNTLRWVDDQIVINLNLVNSSSFDLCDVA